MSKGAESLLVADMIRSCLGLHPSASWVPGWRGCSCGPCSGHSCRSAWWSWSRRPPCPASSRECASPVRLLAGLYTPGPPAESLSAAPPPVYTWHAPCITSSELQDSEGAAAAGAPPANSTADVLSIQRSCAPRECMLASASWALPQDAHLASLTLRVPCPQHVIFPDGRCIRAPSRRAARTTQSSRMHSWRSSPRRWRMRNIDRSGSRMRPSKRPSAVL